MTIFYISLPEGDTYFVWRQYIYIEINKSAKAMKQRAITLIIIIIAFLSIFSVNYEVFNRLRDSKVFQSEIFSPVKKSSTQDETGMCDSSSTKSSLDRLSTSTINLFRITL